MARKKPAQPRKIAILGTASASLKKYPETDESWELWGMVKAAIMREVRKGEGCARYFEPHTRKLWEQKEHLFATVAQPIYMREHVPEIPSSLRYPIEDVLKFLPDALYGPSETSKLGTHRSTVAYMLGFAIYSLGDQRNKPVAQRDSIGLWGVEMLAEDEYGYQKPNCEALLGFAMGLGINVVIPKESSLMKGNEPYGYTDRTLSQGPINYDLLFRQKRDAEEQMMKSMRAEAGAEHILRFLGAMADKLQEEGKFEITQEWLNGQFGDYTTQRSQLLDSSSRLRGSAEKMDEYMALLQHFDRGGTMAG